MSILGTITSKIANCNVSTESNAPGTQRELEYEIYGIVEDMSTIDNLDAQKETQEQYERLLENGSIRIRATTKDDATEYVMTLKSWEKGKDGRKESNSEAIESEFFEHWKEIATSGVKKTRYFVPAGKQKLNRPENIEKYGEYFDLVWEIDVFQGKDGNPCNWVKLDLEVKEPLKEFPPTPLKLTDTITSGSNSRTEEERKKIRHYYDNVFNVKAEQ
tara:strand:- start:82779 stop:83429 length:651 start_codon:yes stop_codon:yes gene_type:complete